MTADNTRPADGEFVMVPREPTGDMLDAMIAPWLRGAGTERECLTAGWKGALSAAPQQPAEAVAERVSPEHWIAIGRAQALAEFTEQRATARREKLTAPAIDIGKLRHAADEVAAWFRSGNSVPVDLNYLFRSKWPKLLNDINNLLALIGDGGEKANG